MERISDDFQFNHPTDYLKHYIGIYLQRCLPLER